MFMLAALFLILVNVAILVFAVTQVESLRCQLADLFDGRDTRELPQPSTLISALNVTRGSVLL